MSEFLLKPKELEVEKDEAHADQIQFEQMSDELAGATRADGAENVAEAVAEVSLGQARPEALLAWIDDLREPEEQHGDAVEDDNLERSFTVDFIPDTARDGGAQESPPGEDYMFSAVRRIEENSDDDGGGGGGGGGGGDGDGDAPDDESADPDDPKKPTAGEKTKGDKDPKDAAKDKDKDKKAAKKAPAKPESSAPKPAKKKSEPPPGGGSGGTP